LETTTKLCRCRVLTPAHKLPQTLGKTSILNNQWIDASICRFFKIDVFPGFGDVFRVVVSTRFRATQQSGPGQRGKRVSESAGRRTPSADNVALGGGGVPQPLRRRALHCCKVTNIIHMGNQLLDSSKIQGMRRQRVLNPDAVARHRIRTAIPQTPSLGKHVEIKHVSFGRVCQDWTTTSTVRSHVSDVRSRQIARVRSGQILENHKKVAPRR